MSPRVLPQIGPNQGQILGNIPKFVLDLPLWCSYYAIMKRQLVNPKWCLVHKHHGWSRSFDEEKHLLDYLEQHRFNRARLEEYFVIYGDGAWSDIAVQLPQDRDGAAGNAGDLQSPW